MENKVLSIQEIREAFINYPYTFLVEKMKVVLATDKELPSVLKEILKKDGKE